MANKLFIVESPAKSRTISRYLGKDFKVVATMGHIIDLPKSKLGVDIEEGFQPQYEVIPEKRNVVNDLKKQAAKADEIYLAADPDREGEAICWHLHQLLDKKGRKIFRVTFNEITGSSVKQAVEHPGEINRNKFDAQQTRRIIDRLVGYKVSPLLWDKVKRGLSAGRVQTVALRIICDREKQIKAFNKEEYWSITGSFNTPQNEELVAKLTAVDGKKVRSGNARTRYAIETEEQAQQIVSELRDSDFTVSKLARKTKKRHPLPPFITSKLQQEAARVMDFPVKKTMTVAQRLYEGKEIGSEGPVGLITYMRTDSTRVAGTALDQVRTYIEEAFGKEMMPDKPNFYSSKAGAQDAHEAIRPTNIALAPDKVKKFLSRDELALYRLIWNRFVASQMISAQFAETTVTVSAGRYDFTASGTVVVEPGFTRVYNPGIAKDKVLPATEEGDTMDLTKLDPVQNFTTPPPRYTEPTLVKELESNGVGRPSTYASILSVIRNRAYVEMHEKKFHPTPMGELVNDLLVDAFPDLFEVGYTAELEEDLDQIEQGEIDWLELLNRFHQRLKAKLDNADSSMVNVKVNGLPTDQKCDKCGGNMVIKAGRYGLFLSCDNYPDCKNTREIGGNGTEETDKECPECGKNMVLKSGRYGKYYQCSDYPDCETRISARNGEARQLDRECPKCGKTLVERSGKYGKFVACSGYPECRYIENGNRETDVPCPKCEEGKVVRRRSRRGKSFYGCSRYPDCRWISWTAPEALKNTPKNKSDDASGE